jgi:hypothetical protein
MRKVSTFSHTGSDVGIVYKTGEHEYSVVHLQEWDDLDSSAVELYGKYNVIVHNVDVRGYGNGEVERSLNSCGLEILTQEAINAKPEAFSDNKAGDIWCPYSGNTIAHYADKHYPLVIVEAMYGYGAGDRAYDDSGNNKRTLLTDARRWV